MTGARPWLVPVTVLRRRPGEQREELRSARVGELVVVGSSVAATTVATAEVTLTSVRGGIEVAGVVRAAWQGECRRCLASVGGELECRVRELYRPRGRAPDAGDDEADTYALAGDQLDLLPLVRDALLLELPLAPLCRRECAGLCPSCGADLSSGPCGCPRAADTRWAALDVLRGRRLA